ncbi:sodium:proton antiporter [uncultured Bifidobacterium sp.]|uniref:cation:proton antiporter n=1 Tax=uncultured Bifidobacterium sp. TaxID=165187 RepID=UPI002639308C|nr:sodium:proton antiporter [uncultured Bifidobacterium sp.]
MNVLTLILCIVGSVVLSSFISRFIPRVSTPLVQIGIGALATLLPVFPQADLEPELFMLLFIAPLLYLEAHRIDKTALLNTLGPSLSLAVGLALATMVAVGLSVNAVWSAVPMAGAFALGAALGPTDAVAVSSLGHEASLSSRQRGTLEGESLFNDASGIIGFQFSILAAVTGTLSVHHAAEQFLTSFVGGTLIGIAVGLAANWIFETSRSLGWETTTTRILMELFLPFLVYLGAQDLAHVSGVLAVVAAGLTVRFDRTGIGPNVSRTNIVADSVWSVLSFSLNGAVFILLGMQLPDAMSASWDNPGVSNALLLGIIALTSVVVIGMRFLWVAGMLRMTKDAKTRRRRRMTPSRWRSAMVMTVGGAKGTITLSLMFTIPYTVSTGDAFPMRDELIFIASGVIIVTLVLANFLLPLLAPNRAVASTEMTRITIDVLRRTVEELTGRVSPENRRSVLHVIDSYTKRITRLKQRLGASDPQDLELLQIEALHWEKDYVKQRLERTKAFGIADDSISPDLQVEACERILDLLMNTLRHTSSAVPTRGTVSQIRGRFRALQRRLTILARRGGGIILRTTPLMSENRVYAAMRSIQIDAMEYVIDRLYEEMGRNTYRTEHCSTLILDYRRAEASLRNRPNVSDSADAIMQTEEAKRDSYAIELGIIQDMYESGRINRTQMRQLRRNVYVMQVDAESEL